MYKRNHSIGEATTPEAAGLRISCKGYNGMTLNELELALEEAKQPFKVESTWDELVELDEQGEDSITYYEQREDGVYFVPTQAFGMVGILQKIIRDRKAGVTDHYTSYAGPFCDHP